MQEQKVKVGDVVAWADVPSGALVRGSWDGRDYFIERHRWRYWVKNENNAWWAAEKVAPALRAANLDTLVTIVALDIPVDATAEHLRGLAEVFEVREALHAMRPLDALVATGGIGPDAVVYTFDEAAPLLRKAGWRPGMTAEDAARMLADLDPGCPDGLGCELCFDQDDPA